MEFLSAQTKYIAEQLRTLSVSGRVAIALLVVVLLVGMWGMIRWAGQPAWTDLFNQALTVEEIQEVGGQLRLVGVEMRVEGDRIMVHGDESERQRIHGLLGAQGAMPKDTSLGYAELVKQDNVWESDRVKTWKQHRGLEAELANVLRRFPGIEDARVLIVVPERRTVLRSASTSTASVKIKPGGGGVMDKGRIEAIAAYVAGAVPGLEAKNVTITDGSRSYRVPDATQDLATDLLAIQRQQEDHYRKKIYDQLQHIKDVVVNVRAELRQDDVRKDTRTLGPPVTNKVSEKETEVKGGGVAVGPGVRPNQARAVADAGQGSVRSETESEESLEGERDWEGSVTNEHASSVVGLTASVNVPSSFLLRILAAQDPDNTDTTRGAIQKIADVELPKIEDQVKPLVGATEDQGRKLVVVDWYYDMPAEEPTTATAAAPIEVLALAREYGPQAGLALLAAFSLFMVFRIAKKAQGVAVGPATAVAAAGAEVAVEGPEGPLQQIDGGAAAVGEAREMDGVLVGHEVDESMVRTQQIVGQISQMMKDDPAAAASVVDHWLREEP